MLESTLKYLQQFRARNFFLFLEWCTFVAKKHNLPGSEGLIESLAEELAICDIDEKDIYTLGLLDFLMQSEEILPELLYAYLSIKTAFFMVMEKIGIRNTEHNLYSFNAVYSGEEFFKNILSRIPPQDALIVKKKFAPIISKLNILKQYLLILREHPDIDQTQKLYLSRVCLIENLYCYLKIQSELSGAVVSEVADYIDKIRNHSPFPWEFEFIEKIYAKSVFERITDSITYKLFIFTSLFTSPNQNQNSTIPQRLPKPKN